MDIFDEFLYRNRLTKTEIAEYLGVSNSFITKISNGTRSIPKEKLQKIMSNPNWVTDMFTEPSDDVIFNNDIEDDVEMRSKVPRQRSLPLLPFDAVAGYMSDNNGIDAFRGDAVTFSDFIEQGADCVIRVGGDSMYPRYKNGDVLAIKILRDPQFFQWGRVYVLNTTQGCIVKMLFQDPEDADKIVCHSENTRRFPDYAIHKSDIISIALVVGHAGVE